MDVSVIGGGIVGLSSAYYLACEGADVTVYEKSTIGAGSTERSAGGIRAQFSTPVNVQLSRESIEVWESFEEEFGVDIAYRRPGYLFLARERPTVRQFERNVEMQNELGFESECLSPEEATDYCPGLDPDPFKGATYCSRDGFADPHLALQGFSQGLREYDVTVETGTAVTAIEREGDDGPVTGVVTDDGRVRTEFVVNAAGPWAGRVNDLAGIDVPISPKRRQVCVADPSETVPESVPLTIDLDTGSYFRPEREGRTLVGGHFGGADPLVDPDDFSTDMDLSWAVEALERASEYTTYFGDHTEIVRGWAGLYAVTPDHHPIIEETVPGFVNAAGFSGHGFQHAPATGKLVAELVLNGDASLVDISSLGSDRFEDGSHLDERNVA